MKNVNKLSLLLAVGLLTIGCSEIETFVADVSSRATPNNPKPKPKPDSDSGSEPSPNQFAPLPKEVADKVWSTFKPIWEDFDPDDPSNDEEGVRVLDLCLVAIDEDSINLQGPSTYTLSDHKPKIVGGTDGKPFKCWAQVHLKDVDLGNDKEVAVSVCHQAVHIFIDREIGCNKKLHDIHYTKKGVFAIEQLAKLVEGEIAKSFDRRKEIKDREAEEMKEAFLGRAQDG